MSPQDLSNILAVENIVVGRDAIDQWLNDAGNRRRKIRKDLAGGEHPDRNPQFLRIAELIQEYEALGNPWFSMDSKAKELLGTLYRKGRARSTAASQACYHDYPSWASGVVIPHGIYDRVANRGHINLGLTTVLGLMRKASTATGLTTTVNVIHREYETRRNAAQEIKQNLRLIYDNLLSNWNYNTVVIARWSERLPKLAMSVCPLTDIL